MANVGNVEIDLTLDDSKISGQLEKVRADIDHAVTSSGKSTRSQVEMLGASIGKAGLAMATALTVPIIKAGKEAISLASDYENAVAKVFTISDSSQLSDSQLAKDILDLSTQTGKSATELAEAAYQALSASVETEHVVGFVEDAVGLAKAGFLETADSVDVLTTIINAYGYSAEDADMIAGRLVQTQNKGKTTVNELAQSMGQVIPTASAYNVSLDNLTSAYVIMTKQGINTANATTALNGMMNELANEGSDVAKVLKDETGKTFGELMSEGYNLGDVLQILYDKADGNSEAFANMFGNIRARLGALSIANAGAEEFAQAMADMADSGSLVEQALEKLDTPAVKWERANNALNNTLIQMGEEILGAAVPALDALAKGAQDVYEWFSGLDEGTKQLIIGVAGLTAGVGALTAVISGVRSVRAIADIGKYYGALNKATSAAKGAAAATEAMNVANSKGAVSFKGIIEGAKKSTTAMAALKGGAALAGAALAALAVYGIAQLVKQYQRHQQIGSTLRKSLMEQRDSAKEAQQATESLSTAVERSERHYFNAARAVDEMVERQDALAESIAQRNFDLEVGVRELDGYRDSIARLNGTTDESSFGELNAAVEGLNSKLGTNYEVVGNVSDGYYIMADGARVATDDILKLVDAQELQMRLDATRETRRQLMEEEYRAAQDLAAANMDLAEQQNAVDEAYAAAGEMPWYLQGAALEAAGSMAEQTGQYAAKVDELARAHADAEASLEKTKEQESFIAAAMGEGATAVERFVASSSTIQAAMSQSGESIGSFSSALDDAGVSVEELESLSASELAALVADFDGSKESIVSSLSSLRGEAETRGAAMGEGLAQGILSNLDMAANAGAELARAALAGADAVSQYSSPWKTTIKRGEAGAEGLAIGLENGASEAVSAAESMIQKVLTASQIDDAMQGIRWNGASVNYGLSALAPMGTSPQGPSGSAQAQKSERQGPTVIIQELNVQADDAQQLYLDVMNRVLALEAM